MRKISVLILLAASGCAAPVPRANWQNFSDALNKRQYPVTVNYGIKFDSLVKNGELSGHYILFDPEINSRNFSLTISGEKRVQVLLAHFDRQPMTHLEILAALNQQRLRPANPQEFLRFIQAHNSYLKDVSFTLNLFEGQRIEIVCLGSFCQSKKNSYPEVLRWRMSEGMDGLEGIPVSVLDLAPLGLNWLSDSYFAVVSADSAEEDVEIKPKTLEK